MKIIRYNLDILLSKKNSKHCPKCAICFEILAFESMKPFKHKRHLETKHPQYRSKDKQVFHIFSTISHKKL